MLPFTTPDLAFSRVRRSDNGRLEILVSGFSGSRCIYVFPWDQLVSIMRLTLHDRALQAEISLTDSITPMKMRIAGHRVARTGLAGADAAVAAGEALARRAQDVEVTRAAALSRLIEAGLAPGGGCSRFETWNAVRKHKSLMLAVGTLSAETGLPPDICLVRIKELSDVLAPVGFGNSDNELGYLRRVFNRVSDIKESVSAANIGAAGMLVAQTAGTTLRLATTIFTSLDIHFDRVAPVLSDWEGTMTSIRGKVDRLGWLLDGWVEVCEMWQAASADRYNIDFKKIGQIMRTIPLVPKGECERTMVSTVDHQSTVRNKIVQELQDWRTGDFDYEVVHRMETIKARSSRV
jgi:hypothetical protein